MLANILSCSPSLLPEIGENYDRNLLKKKKTAKREKVMAIKVLELCSLCVVYSCQICACLSRSFWTMGQSFCVFGTGQDCVT